MVAGKGYIKPHGEPTNKEPKAAVDFQKERELICEALVREILYAKRWSAIVEAWQALLYVRNQAESLINESVGYYGEDDRVTKEYETKFMER